MANFDIDGDLIRKLAELLRDTGLTEIEFAEGDKRLRVTRGGVAAPVAVQAPVAAAPAPIAQPAVPAAKAAGPKAGAVTSPMVGTVYLAPEPGSEPFVKVGDTVKTGQTILIIEAMKVMNPIKAAKGGVVAEIPVVDGQPVEFGEVLMVVE